jgi:hypothetical protein
MLSAAEGKRQRKALMRDIAIAEKKRQREQLRALVTDLREVRVKRRQARHEAIAMCREGKRAARQRVRELRDKALGELKLAIELERSTAKMNCSSAKTRAAELEDRRKQAKAKLLAERAFRRDMRRIEADNRARRKEIRSSSARERKTESDDEVRGNIAPELVALFEQIKSRIKAGPHQSRTEAFLHYAEEHPDEVIASYEDVGEARIRELERQHSELSRDVRRPIKRARVVELAQASGYDIPF